MNANDATGCREGGSEGPCITVGLPVYNSVNTIEQALEGLLNQTHRQFKLLISDNASTDGTSSILDEWAARDQRIVLHRQQTNIGHTQNFRYVLDQADTEFFTWHASDDFVSSNYLAQMLRALAAQPRCGFVAPKIIHVNVDGTPVEELPVPDVTECSRLGRVKALLRQSWGHRIYGLFRTDELRRAKALAEEFGYVWGWDAVAQLPFMLDDRMCGTNDAILYYRLNEGFSLKLYKPRTRLEFLRFWSRYLWLHLRAWKDSKLPTVEKIACLPALLYHSIDSLKLQPGRATVKLIRRPVRRALKAVARVPARMLSHRK